jgi:hypothetical protein
LGLLIFLVPFTIVGKRCPLLGFIGVHPNPAWASYDHLKLYPMRVPEDVFVRKIAIHAINEIPAFCGKFS